jgi:hypothetical protein
LTYICVNEKEKVMKKNSLITLLLTFSGFIYAQTARVQVIHNSADAAAEFVDVYLDATLLIPNFEFRTASAFIDAPAGTPIDLSVAPPNSTGVQDAIYTATVTLTENETYLVIADGIVSTTGYTLPSSFGLEVIPMGREEASNPSNTDLLVHHGATDAPIVDVLEVGVNSPGATLVDNISYTESQGYLELPTDDYILEVRDETGAVTIAAYEAPLEELTLDGVAAVVVASGFVDPSLNSNGPDFGLYVALPAGGPLVMLPSASLTARVQVIHNSADLAAEFVDVYLNDDLLIPNFEFRTASAFIDAPAGIPIDVSVAPPNSTSVADAIYTETATLEIGVTYIVVADGNISSTGYTLPDSFGYEVYEMGREVATSSTNTDVLVHHGATDAPAVDVVENGVNNPGVLLVNDLSYSEFQGYLELPTDDYILQVRDETGTVGVAAFEAPLSTLALDGAAIVVVASGFLDPSQNSNGEAFGLFVALPSGGDLVPLPSAALGVENFDSKSVAIYPNPMKDELNIDFSALDLEALNIRVVDMQGRTISSNVIDSGNTTLDVSTLGPGIYQLIIADNNNVLDTKKLIKN